MKEQRKPKPIPMYEVIGWIVFMSLVCMFAAIGLLVTIQEFIN